jgi:hypothetical protein
MPAVTDATAQDLVKEIKRAVDLLEKVIAEPAEASEEPQVPEDFSLIAGPALDADVFRIEAHGPIDDTVTAFLRNEATGDLVDLDETQRGPGLLIAAAPLGDLTDGTWKAGIEQGGRELRSTTVDLIA